VIDIGIGRNVKIHDEPHRPVICIGGIHVVHVVHPAHLLFDGRCYRLFDRQRISADVGSIYLDLRRNDIGILGHGKAEKRDDPSNHHDNGDHHCNDGSINEKPCH
jgi:hypothetical protein